MGETKHTTPYATNMTANNAPVPFVAEASMSTWGAFRAFSESLTDDWAPTGLSESHSEWVQIKLDKAIRIWAVKMAIRTTVSAKDSGQLPYCFKIHGSTDGVTFREIFSAAEAPKEWFVVYLPDTQKYDWEQPSYIEITENREAYQYYRFEFFNCQSIDKSNSVTATDANTVKPTHIELYEVEGEVATYHTVTFQDWDGTVLYSETVEDGGGCYYPLADPHRKGHFFTGWDRDDFYSGVVSDVLVTAVYINHGEHWELTEDGTLTIGAEFDMSQYGDPNLGYTAYPWYCSDEIKKVIFLDGVVTIGGLICYGCTEITEAEIPDTVVSIGETAFYKCEKLVSVKIPESVISIGAAAFMSCKSLEGITIPSGITVISYQLFDSCTSLSEITIPDKVAYLGSFSFSGCTALKKIEFLSATTEVDLDSKIPVDTVIYGFAGSTAEAFAKKNFREFVVLTADTYTVSFVDWDGTVLKTEEVNAGESATPPDDPSREGYFFLGWDIGFSSVTGNMTVTAQYVSWKLDKDGTLTVTKEFEWPWSAIPSSYPWYEQNKSILKVVFLEGVTAIGEDSFHGCTNLIEVIIPEGVTTIEYRAFYDCTALREIIIPNSVTSIVANSFYRCSNLMKVIIPEGVVTIEKATFCDCTSLSEITIPKTVTQLESSAFNGCISLAEITIPDSVTKIGSWAFAECTSLSQITIPTQTVSIDRYAFQKCTALKKIEFLSASTKISDLADTIPVDTVIYGYVESTAEAYAKSYGRVFVSLSGYTVIFQDWDGTALLSKNVGYGSSVSPPDDPSREGYFFLGWDKDFSNITEDLTVTAQYDPVATITLPSHEINLIETQNTILVATLLPENLTQKALSWVVSDESIIRFDSETGVIAALKPGTATITVTHVSQEVSVSCKVTVAADVVEAIEIAAPPDKIQFYVGEELDISGLTVKAKYASGKTERLTEGFEVSGYDGSSAGTKTITVTYSGKSVTFDVIVCADSILSIAVTTKPNKVTYVVGEEFDPTGMVVTATWTSGKTETVKGFAIDGFDSTSSGEKTLTVKYRDLTAAFAVEVIADTVISIEVIQLPTKIVYLVGQQLDLAGMVVRATWSMGAVSEVEGFTVSGYDANKVGEQVINVEYEKVETTFKVLVKGISGIELVSSPAKTQYFVGDEFDPGGMQIVAHCTDGTDMDCTANVTIGFNNATINETAAVGSFAEYTIDIPVQVDRAYVGTPTKEDAKLTYDFETNTCVVEGKGASLGIPGVVASYNEKLKKIQVKGLSEVPANYCVAFASLEAAIIGEPLETLPQSMFDGLKKLSHVELPNTLKRLATSCFNGTPQLSEINLPDTIEVIDPVAFYESGLRSIVLPKNLKTIGHAALYGCAYLVSAALNAGLESIGSNCFYGCDSLKTLLIPDTVTEIGNSINSLSLDYVRYPAGVPVIASTAGTNARVIVIPEGVTEITSGAFLDFNRVENVFLPGTLKRIEYSAFSGCTALKDISIPENVEAVRYGAFQNSGLEAIFFYGRNTVVDSTAHIPPNTVVHGYRGSSAETYCQEFGNTFVPFDDYEFTDEIKTLYDKDSVRKRVVIHFPNGEARDIENNRIYSESMSLTESICDEENLVFGGCNASKFEIQVADVEEDIRGLEIEVKQYIEDKYVPIFVGIIDSADRQDNRRFKKVIAYDRMYTDGVQDVTSWLKSLTFPMRIVDLRYAACKKLGFTQTSKALVNDYITISKLSFQAGITGRDVLRAICELNGVFGYITRMGYFDYITLDKSETPYTVSGYRKVKYEEYTVRGIESLSVRGSDGANVLTLGSGNRYVLKDNFLVYGMKEDALREVAKNLLEKIRGISYKDFSGDGRGLPYIFLGRQIQYVINSNFANRETQTVRSYVLKRTLSGIQALKDTYSASGEELQPDIPANTSTVETARQLEDYATLEDLDLEFDTRFEELMQNEQYITDIEAIIKNVMLNGGYYKIVSVAELPAEPEADTVYLIQGEVTVN